MRLSKTVSITLPPEMLSRAAEMAKAENRTMSELVREALRHYESARQWNGMRAYAQAKTKETGVTGGEVATAVRQARGKLWPGYKKSREKRAKTTPKKG